MTRDWVSPRDIRREAKSRIFCLPHAGAGAAGFYAWRRLLPPGIDLCPIHLPGREDRAAEEARRSASGLADEVASAVEEYLDRPFAIVGHSMGALLAFEWTQRITEQGGRQPQLLLVSGRNGPRFPAVANGLHELPDEELVEALKIRFGEANGSLLRDVEVRGFFLPILRADLQLVESYVYRRLPVLECAVMAAGGRSDPSLTAAGLDAWREVTAGRFYLAPFEGDHSYLHGEAREGLVDAMLRVLGERRVTE